ncbi:MAG: hypothetical protein IGS39_01115 [Calothrix sp. C42_A2020_038]|nr:hypothetical protein [Calothrix sp. C42_A2020_038]
MLKYKLFKILRPTLFELWLSLPFIALGCWGLSGIAMYSVINRSYGAKKYLQLEQAKLPPQIVVAALPTWAEPRAIYVEIDKNRGVSRVKVETKNYPLAEIVFEFPVTETNQVEAAISRALGMPHEQTRNLIILK